MMMHAEESKRDVGESPSDDEDGHSSDDEDGHSNDQCNGQCEECTDHYGEHVGERDCSCEDPVWRVIYEKETYIYCGKHNSGNGPDQDVSDTIMGICIRKNQSYLTTAAIESFLKWWYQNDKLESCQEKDYKTCRCSDCPRLIGMIVDRYWHSMSNSEPDTTIIEEHTFGVCICDDAPDAVSVINDPLLDPLLARVPECLRN